MSLPVLESVFLAHQNMFPSVLEGLKVLSCIRAIHIRKLDCTRSSLVFEMNQCYTVVYCRIHHCWKFKYEDFNHDDVRISGLITHI